MTTITAQHDISLAARGLAGFAIRLGRALEAWGARRALRLDYETQLRQRAHASAVEQRLREHEARITRSI